MKTYATLILMCSFTLYASLYAMSKEASHALVQARPTTTNDALTASMSERLTRIVSLFREKGWCLPESIFLKHPREAQGQDVGLCATNGRDTVYAGSGHEKWYSSGEIDFMVAHEVGHIAIKRYPWLNPHRYMDLYLHSATVFLVVNSINFGFWRARRPLPRVLILGIGMGYGASIAKNYTAYTVIRDEAENVIDRSYDSLIKLEELECDLIAALVLPQGGKLGASFMQKTQEIFPEADGMVHPLHETRIEWLKAVQWLQEYSITCHT